MIKIHTQLFQGKRWLERYRGVQPVFACVFGFTATGLVQGISTAGVTPEDRFYTAIKDAEFLYNSLSQYQCPLPFFKPTSSPALISSAILERQKIPTYLFNAGLPLVPRIPLIDLGGKPAKCVSQGCALEITTVRHLLEQGLIWGERLAKRGKYLIVGECVVGGTTTALAILTGLGFSALGKINSSHPTCNHDQKWVLVQSGLKKFEEQTCWQNSLLTTTSRPVLSLLAALGDPMQVVVAGMAIAASRVGGVMLAGGTQMLAVYALIRTIARELTLAWQPEQVVVGTTRWVAEDATGDTVGLAEEVGAVPLLATQLSLANSCHHQLRGYEQGYAKEGVGAGGCAIAANLYLGWEQAHFIEAIDSLYTTM